MKHEEHIASAARVALVFATLAMVACVNRAPEVANGTGPMNPQSAAPDALAGAGSEMSSAGAPAEAPVPAADGGDDGAPSQLDAGMQARPRKQDASKAPSAPADRAPADSPRSPAPAPPDEMPEPPAEPGFWPEDCESRHVFKAHGVAAPGDTTKYRVSPRAQHLVVFRFELPWRGDAQMLAARMIFDNTKIVHHWTLFAIDDPSVRDGEIIFGLAQAGLITLVDAIPLMSVGPGATDMRLPPDVGLRIPSGANTAFALEVHYFNALDTAEEDASGVELCVTSKKRPQVAAMHSLGRIAFALPPRQRTEISSTCRPIPSQMTVQMQGAIPHMHGAGRHAKLTVTRASGEVVTLIDAPYDASEQRTYPLMGDGPGSSFVLSPGDTVTTSCAFDNPTDAVILAGPRVEDEMCTIMLLAWPTGVLTNGMAPGVFGMPDDSTCMEL